MVDFGKLRAKFAEEQAGKKNRLFSILLGVRGSGKSGTAAGTFGKSTKVLDIIFTQEDHGADSAIGVTKYPDNILPVFADLDDAGNKLSTADAYDNLKAILSADLSEFDAVVLDGLSALDGIIAGHPRVLGAKGYDGKKISDLRFDEILTLLKTVGRAGKDVVITCSTELRMNAEGLFMTPTLRGSSAINVIIGACSEVLLMDKVEDAETKKPAFVFNFTGMDINKSGTKMTGDKYMLAVNLRVAGIPVSDLPPVMKASMFGLKKLKGGAAKKESN